MTSVLAKKKKKTEFLKKMFILLYFVKSLSSILWNYHPWAEPQREGKWGGRKRKHSVRVCIRGSSAVHKHSRLQNRTQSVWTDL